MRTHLLRAFVVGLALWIAPLAYAADLTVQIDARDVARKRIHTNLQLSVKPGPLTLVYPKWIPGEHGPTGPIDSLIGLSIKATGKTIPWTRDPGDMYAIRLVVPKGAARLDIAIESGLATGGGVFSEGPTSSENLAILPWNQFLLFPKGVNADSVTIVARVIPPAGWSVASALEAKALSGGVYELEPASISRLIDSPVQMGRYGKRVELQGAQPRSELRHVISIYADSADALETPADFAAGYSRLVAESGALFGTRMYRHYTWLLSLSDHVAHFGLEHHESSDNRRENDVLATAEQRMSLATLIGHEYVHSWNGKYRRPQGLLSPDYQKPMDGSLLWVYEGMTQFWGVVLPTRAGLITPEYFRDYTAAWAGNFDTEPGPRWRPLADTAVAAQTLYTAPDAWTSSRRSVDFYEASIFLWLDVDAELRARSKGRATLDSFVGRFYAGAAGSPQVKAYGEQDVYEALNAVAPNDWRSFIRRHLDQTGTGALMTALERSGWRLAYTREKNSAIEARQKRDKSVQRGWSIGLTLDKDSVIVDAIDDHAAARAGAGPGMKAVAVNGRKYSAEVLDAAILQAQSNRKPIQLLVENADFYRTLSVAYFDGPRFPHLVRIKDRPDILAQVLTARVQATRSK